MPDPHFRLYEEYREYPVETMRARAREFSRDLRRRRSVREFAERPVPPDIIEDCLRAAVSAPSGANMQPWHFVVVRKPEIRHEIRLAAEEEEREFYEQ
ncbi:MAG TPA: nitroreductase family protein, partial [bacterium]|nr:nitroreductase family protein [bacterium]